MAIMWLFYITVAHDAIVNPYAAAFTSVNNLKSVYIDAYGDEISRNQSRTI